MNKCVNFAKTPFKNLNEILIYLLEIVKQRFVSKSFLNFISAVGYFRVIWLERCDGQAKENLILISA